MWISNHKHFSLNRIIILKKLQGLNDLIVFIIFVCKHTAFFIHSHGMDRASGMYTYKVLAWLSDSVPCLTNTNNEFRNIGFYITSADDLSYMSLQSSKAETGGNWYWFERNGLVPLCNSCVNPRWHTSELCFLKYYVVLSTGLPGVLPSTTNKGLKKGLKHHEGKKSPWFLLD